MMVNNDLVGGFNPTPLKNDGVKVSWDDEIPNRWETYNSCSKPPTSLFPLNVPVRQPLPTYTNYMIHIRFIVVDECKPEVP